MSAETNYNPACKYVTILKPTAGSGEVPTSGPICGAEGCELTLDKIASYAATALRDFGKGEITSMDERAGILAATPDDCMLARQAQVQG